MLFLCPLSLAGSWTGPLNKHGSIPYGVFATKHHPGTRAMTPLQPNPDTHPTPDPFRWNRTDTAQTLHDFDHPGDSPRSQRAFAHQAGVPRSTLRHWLRRRQRPGLESSVAAFLENK
jgi:hypothetical protein